MNTYTEMLSHIENSDYDYHFWNAMRGKTESNTRLQRGRDSSTGTYAMAPASNNKYVKALEKESLFRSTHTPKLFKSGFCLIGWASLCPIP